MITENLSTLKIHKLTQEQYDREVESGNLDENAIYLTPENEELATKNSVSNALIGTLRGPVVQIDDVSPINHDVKVSVSLPGREIIPTGDLQDIVTYESELNTVTEKAWVVNLTKGKYVINVTNPNYCGLELLRYDGTSSYEPWTQIAKLNSIGESIPLTPIEFEEIESERQYAIQVREGGDSSLIQLSITERKDPNGAIVHAWAKNLLPFPYKNINGTFGKGDTYENNGMTYAINDDCSITVNGRATSDNPSIFYLNDATAAWKLPAGKYSYSGFSGTYNTTLFVVLQDDVTGENVTVEGIGNVNFECKHTCTVNSIYIHMSNVLYENQTVYPMIRLQSASSDYEPYVEPKRYAVDAKGNVIIPSVYPTMTIYSEANGVITVDYHKDLNKAFNELVNAILSLGGNI